jgi:chloramphenicol 3-O phosphotransferase
VILNGAPRSGKSSIAAAIQETFEGVWVNLGVDVSRRTTPPQLQPGIGLRPGEADHPTAPFVPLLYAALYESVAAHSRLGMNVVVDVGHHDGAILTDSLRRLDGLPMLFVGVRCPADVLLERRRTSDPGRYAASAEAVTRWEAVHGPWSYDLELDTSRLSPAACAAAIARRLALQK